MDFISEFFEIPEGVSKIIFIIWVICAGIQLLFWLFWFSRLAFYKMKSETTTPNSEGVSVVICARNELTNLRELLPRLYDQHYENFEIIVVNDRSGDGSYDFLREEEQKQPLLEVAHIEQTPDHIQEKKYAVMLGIRKAKNDIILLTDADCIPNTSLWIQSMAGKFTDGIKIVLGYSQYMKRKGFLNFMIRHETLYTGIQYLSAALAGSPYMGVGRNLAYRKSFFLEKNGFSGFEKVVGGDDDLFVNKNAKKKNTAICIGEDAMVFSHPKTSFKTYFKQKRRHLSVGKRYRWGNKTTLAILSLSHILFWLSFITLAIVMREPLWLLIGFFTRFVLVLITFIPTSKKLGDTLTLWNLVMMDLFYVVYYVITGIPSLFSKKVTWR